MRLMRQTNILHSLFPFLCPALALQDQMCPMIDRWLTSPSNQTIRCVLTLVLPRVKKRLKKVWTFANRIPLLMLRWYKYKNILKRENKTFEKETSNSNTNTSNSGGAEDLGWCCANTNDLRSQSVCIHYHANPTNTRQVEFYRTKFGAYFKKHKYTYKYN